MPRPRAEGAGMVVFEAENVARERGARIIAEVTTCLAWRDAEKSPLASLAAPTESARVVVPRSGDADVDALLDASSWKDVPRVACDGAGGEHEALGAIAIGAAVSEILRGTVKQALIVGLAKGRGYALRLESRC